MLIVNRSEYPTPTVAALLRYALLETETTDGLTVEVADLTEEGSPAQVQTFLPGVRTGTEGCRLFLLLASPVRFPAVLFHGIAADDWHEALLAAAAWGARTFWWWQRHRPAPPDEEADANCAHFVRWKLMGYRKLKEHNRLWGWVPLGRDGFAARDPDVLMKDEPQVVIVV